MHHVLEALVRWMAPILSFTAEEMWDYLPGKRGESVFFETWYEGWPEPTAAADGKDREFWDQILAVRQAAAKELEKLRVAGGIGSGLDAEVDIYGDDTWNARLQRLGDELRFVLIVSYARVHALADKPAVAVDTGIPGLAVRVAPSTHTKCIRCWHHREDVGKISEHPQICGRCVQNVAGPGEARSFA
jgi:isoleucyl-tRNA synthetase